VERLERLQTGIPGLDTILKGGLVAGASYIIQGRPGSGKTIFANQIAFGHAAAGGNVLFATLLAENHDRLFQFLSTLGFFQRDLVGSAVQFVSAFDTLANEGLDEVVKLLRREISRQRSSLLIVDGLLNARSQADTPLDTKRFIARLQGHAAFAGCTVLFLTSSRMEEGSPEHTMVDGVIELHEQLFGSRSVRQLQLRKTRGSSAMSGVHEMEITDTGIAVHPRLEAMISPPPETDTSSDPRLTSGIPTLDVMIDGGLPRASCTMVMGPTGAGKTSVGLAFLSGCSKEEPGLLFGLYESPGRLLKKAQALGFDLASKVQAGHLTIQSQLPNEPLLDALGHQLLEMVAATGARRLFLDSMSRMARAATDPSRVTGFFSALTDELRAREVTVMTSWETADLLGRPGAPLSEISPIVDNLLLIRFVDRQAELRRILTVLKTRDSWYDPTARDLLIGSKGIDLVTPVQTPLPPGFVLPHDS